MSFAKIKRVIPEKAIENHILKFLWINKVFAWKNQSTGMWDATKKLYRKSHNPFHIKGVADIIGVYEGRLLAIEVKSEKGVVSKEQREFLDKVNAKGGIGFVARSIKDVEMVLFLSTTTESAQGEHEADPVLNKRNEK